MVDRGGLPRWRVVATAALATAVLVLPAGCATVPDGGAPVAVPNPTLQQGEPYVANVDSGLPRPSAKLDETISAYLNATARTQTRPRLADAFLTRRPRDAFLQGKGLVLVRSPQTTARRSGDTAVVTFSGVLVGRIADDNGIFVPGRSGERYVATAELRRTGGVWMFDTPPPVLVRESDMGTALSQVTLYFAGHADDAGTINVVVPEVRYLEGSYTGAARATRIVRILLAGPSEWLSGVAHNPLPPRTTLRSNVTFANDTVVVELSPDVESASEEAVNAFAAQVGWSLRDRFPGPLRLIVNGRDIAVGGVKPVQGPAQWERYDPLAAPAPPAPLFYVDRAGAVRSLGPDPAIDERNAEPSLDSPQLRDKVLSAAVSRDLDYVAAVRVGPGTRQTLWLGESRGALVPTALSGAAMGRPSWGRGARAVLVPVDGRVWQVSPGGAPALVRVPSWLRPVQAVRVAPDGLRVALVAGSGAATRVYLGLLTPGPDEATPPAVSRPVAVVTGPGQVGDVGWYDPVTLAAAVQHPGGAFVTLAPVDGSPAPTTLPRAPARVGPVRVASIPMASPAPVLLEVNGQIYRLYSREARVETELAGGLGRAPFYPG